MTQEAKAHQLALEDFRQLKAGTSQEGHGSDYSEVTRTILNEMGALGSNIGGLFECMEIAEDEIAKTQLNHPDTAGDIWNSFTILAPSPILEPRTPEIYRAHAQEMLQRVVQGQTKKNELEAATASELCCIFCQTSQLHGLQSDAVVAYQKVFKQVFPDAPFHDEVIIQESYPGRADEILGELRRKFQQPRQMRPDPYFCILPRDNMQKYPTSSINWLKTLNGGLIADPLAAFAAPFPDELIPSYRSTLVVCCPTVNQSLLPTSFSFGFI